MSEPKKRTEKKTDEAEKVKRTDAERATAHLEKVERQVQAVAKATGKLAKSMTSRKYPLTEAQKTHALEYLQNASDSFAKTLSGKVETKPEFKLPQ